MPLAQLPLSYSIYDIDSPAVIYEVDLGGIKLRPSTITAQLRYAGASTLSVTLPDIRELSEIQNRSGSLMELRMRGQKVLSATVDSVQYTVDSSSSQISIDAKSPRPYAKMGVAYVTRIISRSGRSSERRFTAPIDTIITPGVLVSTPYDTFYVGEVGITISPTNATMSVSELTAQQEASRAELENSGTSVYQEQRPL